MPIALDVSFFVDGEFGYFYAHDVFGHHVEFDGGLGTAEGIAEFSVCEPCRGYEEGLECTSDLLFYLSTEVFRLSDDHQELLHETILLVLEQLVTSLTRLVSAFEIHECHTRWVYIEKCHILGSRE